MSKFITIEGLDGAGKSTQIELLVSYFDKKGIPHKFVHFPRSGQGLYGELVAKFLRGEFGRVSEVHPQLVTLLFAGDRMDFSNTITNWLKSGYYVLADRYVNSNIAFQCAKTEDVDEKEYLRTWIEELEYTHNKIPIPDISLFLDVPLSFIEKSLKETRKGEDRSYLNGKDDIHESDLSLQRSVRDEYLRISKKNRGVKIIKCSEDDGTIMSKEMIQRLIIDMI